MIMCDCFTIDRPWPDPLCNTHGLEAERKNAAEKQRYIELEDRISYLENKIEELSSIIQR